MALSELVYDGLIKAKPPFLRRNKECVSSRIWSFDYDFEITYGLSSLQVYFSAVFANRTEMQTLRAGDPSGVWIKLPDTNYWERAGDDLIDASALVLARAHDRFMCEVQNIVLGDAAKFAKTLGVSELDLIEIDDK